MKKGKHLRSKEYLATAQQVRKAATGELPYSQRLSEQPYPQSHQQSYPQTPLQFPQKYYCCPLSHNEPDLFDRRQKASYKFRKNIRQGYDFATSQNKFLQKDKTTPTHKAVAILEQRLQNIHDHYKAFIDQQKGRIFEKTQSVLQLMEEMQIIHQDKVQNLKKKIAEMQEETRSMKFVDNKMSEIETNVQELISQSGILKQRNDQLIKKIKESQQKREIKQGQFRSLKEQMLQARNQIKAFENKNIKNNRINTQIIELFQTAMEQKQ